MGIKKQVGTGIMALVLGLTLIGGGTYAYFSDSETTNNTFAAGTLDLSVNPTAVIDVENMQPGDSMTRDFELQNSGTLDMKNINLETDYTMTNVNGDGDFGKHIEVEFLYNADQWEEVIYETTLFELKEMSPEVVQEKVFDELMEDGLEAGTVDDMVVNFNFIDNGEDQNQFQGASLDLEWTFNAQQEVGTDKY